MIRHITHVFSTLENLQAALATGAIAQATTQSNGLLVQVYSAQANKTHIDAIVSAITEAVPNAVIIGATTVGEVAHGRLTTNQTVIGFTFFESSQAHVLTASIKGGDEHMVGAELGQRIRDCSTHIAGILLLATPLSMDAAVLIMAPGQKWLDKCPLMRYNSIK